MIFNKVAGENNGVEYLLRRQYLFDDTVVAKRMKSKDYKKMLIFWLWLKQRIRGEKFDSTREWNLLQSSKNYAKLK